MGSKRNTGKKRRAPEKAGEHRKNEELWQHRKNGENFGKFHKKEKTSKKAGEHQKSEEIFSGTGKTGRAKLRGESSIK